MGNSARAFRQDCLNLDGVGKRYGGIDGTGYFHATIGIENLDRFGEDIADDSRRHHAQADGTRNAARLKIVN